MTSEIPRPPDTPRPPDPPAQTGSPPPPGSPPAMGLDVDVDEVLDCAAALADTAAQVGVGPAESARLTVAAPGWASTEAARALTTTAQLRLASVAGAVSLTGQQVAAAAAEYRAADDRAAGRLRALR